MSECAIRGCKRKGLYAMSMNGNFGAVIAFMLCKHHYGQRDELFEWVNDDGSISRASEHV